MQKMNERLMPFVSHIIVLTLYSYDYTRALAFVPLDGDRTEKRDCRFCIISLLVLFKRTPLIYGYLLFVKQTSLVS